MAILNLDLGTRSYPIYIDSGLISKTDLLSSHIRAKRVCIVTNDIVGDGNDVQTFNYINNELKPLKMINWFGDFKYRLLSKNTPNCIELLEGYQLTYDYDFTDKNSVEISSWLITENESENCFKGNSIKYKLNKENRTFDIVDVYWKKNSIE